MIVTEILGSLHEPAGAAAVGSRAVDPVMMSGADRVKRIQRLRTRGGRELGLRLPAGRPDLADGDILALTDETAIVVRVETTDVLLITPDSALRMGVVAHTLGNRHLPAQFFSAESPVGRRAGGATMAVEYDHTVEAYLTEQEVPHRRTDLVLDVPFRHAGHRH